MRGIRLVVLGMLLLMSCNRPSHSLDTLFQADMPFSRDLLTDLTPFASPNLEEALTQRYLLVIYFSELGCSTCANRDLHHMTDLYEALSSVNFILIAHGQDTYYLRSLRRAGNVAFPMYTEETLGAAGFPEAINISLIDLQEERILLRYYPLPGEQADHFQDFEEKVRTLITPQN